MAEKSKQNKINTNPFPMMEEQVLNFWDKAQIFKKSVAKSAPRGEYVFYDGPPFATGTPHYGHIVASTIKDVVPRYWTMQGYRVERTWGWDCHGLPIENIVEKEMGSKSKKDIEKIGVKKFNELCRSKVLGYVSEWEKVIRRLGRWADMKNAYKTMDLDFMESVWWVFKQLWDKGLIYQGYRSMHVCPRCETTLSQQEVAEGYKNIKDLSATAKFELMDEPGTFVLAWTTTPWTLIGNAALAVGRKIEYVIIGIKNQESGIMENFIAAKDRLKSVKGEYEIIKRLKGKDLIGKRYKPLFDYYAGDENLKNRENGWKIYAADFVNITEGTGVVHIAPAFGEDDMNLGKEHSLPFIQHVKMDGTIKMEAKDFAGMNVKPADDTQKTDVEIIKYLAHHGLLFHKEKYEHSYPHCWRCETPLINYATTSWFVSVLKVKARALELAKKINWSPAHIKAGRFGNWLAGARDWSISRQRFWASVMPIWQCAKCGEMKVFGSVEELYQSAGGQITKLILVRHGEAENNILEVNSSSVSKYHLTAKVKKEVSEAILKIKGEISKQKEEVMIFSSPALRAKETAELIAKKLGLEIIFSEEIKELNFGSWEDTKRSLPGEGDELRKKFDLASPEEKYDLKYGYTGENQKEVRERMHSWFLKVLAEKQGKTIIVVSHGDPIINLISALKEYNKHEAAIALYGPEYPQKGGVKIIYIDNTTKKEIDLHKHIVDKITFKCEKCDDTMKRVPDVLDTWFDSGSMPYAQMHYPFQNKAKFEANFPAEFIAEGDDQTRAWFYYLHIIATAIKGSQAFKNVIVNGIILAEDGKKMAKRLKNYPDPMEVFNKYGADAMRYYLISSSVIAAENLNFSEAGVREALQKNIMVLWNVYKFYEMYESESKVKSEKSKVESDNILDKWILAKLDQLVEEVTENMNRYDLPRSARPLAEFINDFSTWYLRRSRERFKSDDAADKQDALATLKYVLIELAKVMAPFTPFIAEIIWQKVGGYNFNDENKSVHLEAWPEQLKIMNHESRIMDEMQLVRKIVELGLAKRDQAGVKVRQALSELRIKNYELRKEYQELLQDELNVKNVVAENGKGEITVELDTVITDELKMDGLKREIVRLVNNLRKNAGLTIKDKIILNWHSDSILLKKVFGEMAEGIKRDVLCDEIAERETEGKTVKVNEENVILEVIKK